MFAPHVRQQALLGQVFDTLGQGFQPHFIGHSDDRRDHALLVGVLLHVGDKAAVDLQAVHGQFAQRADRGMAGAEIIKADAAAQIGDADDVFADAVIGIIGDHRFQNFDAQSFRFKARAVQRALKFGGDVRVAEFIHGQVHRHFRHVVARFIPRFDRVQ